MHDVTTADGYILTCFRIPCNRNCDNLAESKPVVWLQHGLLDSSYTWVNNYEHQSLGFLLADAGYDVWFGNNRGNTYGKRHEVYTTEDKEFWEFSWDEMAKYDLPAFINYALEVTGRSNLAYVGHSEGTIQAFAGFSLDSNADVSSKVSLFVALAPVAYVSHLESKLLRKLAEDDVATNMYNRGLNEFLPSTSKIEQIAPGLCQHFPYACDITLMAICGPSRNLNATRIQVYVSQTPAGTSVPNMMHWTQGVLVDTFQMMDWGADKNTQLYGQSVPPLYDLSKVRVPTALFYGDHDYLADPTDVKRLIAELPASTIVFENHQAKYAHLDYTWAYNANEYIYNDVLDLFEQYL